MTRVRAETRIRVFKIDREDTLSSPTAADCVFGPDARRSVRCYNMPGMTNRPVLIVLILAVVLGAASFVVLRKPATAQTSQPIAWLKGLDVTQLRSVQFDWGNGAPVANIMREPATGEWLLLRVGSPARPIGVERLRPFLRLLSDLAPLEGEKGARPPEAPITLTIALSNDTTHMIRIGSSPLGGKVVAAIDDEGTPRVMMIDDGIRRMVQAESLLAWRDAKFFPRSGLDPSRVRVEANGTALQLSRVQGRWGVVSPLSAPASDEAMKALIRQLATLKGERLLDEVDAASDVVGVSNASAALRLESDLRIPRGNDVDRRTLVEEFRIGKPADLGGGSFYATSTASLVDPTTGTTVVIWGPTTLTVSKDVVASLSMSPTTFVSKRSVPFPGADVRDVQISVDAGSLGGELVPSTADALRRKFRQSAKGWQSLSGPSESEALPKSLEGADAAGVAGLVRALCDIDAGGVGTIVNAEAKTVATCMIEGVGSNGSVVVRIGEANEGGKAVLVVQVGTVLRVYQDEWAGGLIGWLKEQVAAR
jgi:hypothetical protein